MILVPARLWRGESILRQAQDYSLIRERMLTSGLMIHLGYKDRNFTPCKSSNIRL